MEHCLPLTKNTPMKTTCVYACSKGLFQSEKYLCVKPFSSTFSVLHPITDKAPMSIKKNASSMAKTISE